MKILITGVAGLFGSNFSRHLIGKGYDIIGLDNLSGGYQEHIDESVRFSRVDLLDHDQLEKLFQHEKPDIVYHFAAYAAESLSPFIRRYNYLNNIICSVNLINSCLNCGTRKIIFTSSMAVYGSGQTPFKEEQTPCPTDPYGIAKYAIEQDLQQAYSQFGLKYGIVRPHNVIGIYQNIWDQYRNVIGIWIRQCLENQSLTIFGDGLQVRAFSDIKFCLPALESLMSLDNQIVNIGSDKCCSILDAAKIVASVANKHGLSVDIKHLDARHETHTAYSDHSKAKKILYFEDNTDLYECVDRMFKWAILQPKRAISAMNYEVSKGIYDSWKKK